MLDISAVVVDYQKGVFVDSYLVSWHCSRKYN